MSSDILQHEQIEQLVVGMAERLRAGLHPETAMIGIQTGGVWIADRLRQHLGVTEALGELNIAFYRDDFSHIGMHPSVQPSNLPFDVEGRHVLLVDDILYTGRTVRAALNEIFDYGRPASVRLAVLVDRGGRELPIQPDTVGTTLSLRPGQHAKLTGPDPLTLRIHSLA
jgi:pyrimidine operon attenuation protein / uracil phosphoribosyltransferase